MINKKSDALFDWQINLSPYLFCINCLLAIFTIVFCCEYFINNDYNIILLFYIFVLILVILRDLKNNIY